MEKLLYNKGFTLVEMLFILSIISICMLFTLHTNVNTNYLQSHMEYLQYTFYKAKAIAMNEKRTVFVHIHETNLEVDFSPYVYKKGIVCSPYSFSINAKGNVNMANHITCTSNNMQARLIITLGNTSFYVQ